MTIAELIALARYRINDTGDGEEQTKSDTELMSYYNGAVEFLSDLLIARNDPEMITEVSIANGADVPANFVRFAGEMPAYINAGTFVLYETGPAVVRYFATKGRASDVEDDVPFKDRYTEFLLQAMAIFALNSDEYTVTQDQALLKASLEALSGAMGQ